MKHLSTIRRYDFFSNPHRIIKELFFPVGNLSDGIINWISTKGFTQIWENPCDSGLIKIVPSTSHANVLFSNVSAVVSNHENTFYTSPSKGPPHYIDVILPSEFKVSPTHYILGAKSGMSPLRNWNLLAKRNVEDENWEIISQHEDDESLQNGSIFKFDIQQSDMGKYGCYRIESTGAQGGKKGQTHVGTSAFELFGSLYID
jgi:hypothetical protein